MYLHLGLQGLGSLTSTLVHCGELVHVTLICQALVMLWLHMILLKQNKYLSKRRLFIKFTEQQTLKQLLKLKSNLTLMVSSKGKACGFKNLITPLQHRPSLLGFAQQLVLRDHSLILYAFIKPSSLSQQYNCQLKRCAFPTLGSPQCLMQLLRFWPDIDNVN